MNDYGKIRELNGKSLVFTDLHVGISNDKPSRQKIAENVIDEIIGRIETEGIKQVFFLGDLFHQRTAIEVTSLNVANDLVRKLSRVCEVFLLQGNHDLYEKYNSVITSLNIFELNNVNVISTPTEVKLNGQNLLLVPWLCGVSLDDFISESKLSDKYDMMMGHFDISYSGDIRCKGKSYADAYKDGSLACSQVEKGNVINEILHHTNPYSTIYMGHIHDHETVLFENRTWNIVGSPQYQVHDMKHLPDSKKMHGYFIMDENNKEKFYETYSIPKFVTVYASEIANGTIDTSKLNGSIIRRCYDVILTDEQKSELDKIVNDANVYEEDSSVFVLGVTERNEDEEELDSTSAELLIDKFDYIKSQIDKINHPSIDNDKLFSLMKEYYTLASN